jgi:hypothetical protein
MSNPTIVLAPDAPRVESGWSKGQVNNQYNEPVEVELDNISGDWRSVMLSAQNTQAGISLSEAEARHLRDWLCEQFGLPAPEGKYACGGCGKVFSEVWKVTP